MPGAGAELVVKRPMNSHISFPCAAKSAAFDPEFAFVEENWQHLPEEIRALIVQTVRRGLDRVNSRKLLAKANGQ